MPTKSINKFFKQSREQIKSLRKRINELKEDQKEQDQEIEKIKAPKEKKRQELVVHFSLWNIAQSTVVILALLALANFIGEVAEIIFIFFTALLFAAALDPTVDALEKRKIPRSISVLFIFLILITVLGFFISQLIPLIAIQLIEVAKNLNELLATSGDGAANYPFSEKLQPLINDVLSNIDRELLVDQLQQSLEGMAAQLKAIAGDTLSAIKGIFNGIANFVIILILTFFLVVDEKGVYDFFTSLFPSKHGQYIIEKSEAIKHKVGYWLRGQVILMFVMFIITWIGFMIIGVDFALTLAMIAGIAELIPVVGPIIAGVPAVLVAFNQSYWLVLWVLGFIIIIQQLEGSFLVPLVMRRAVGLSPIIIIVAMLVGFKTLGVLGAIIAIPVTTAISIFVKDYAAKKK